MSKTIDEVMEDVNWDLLAKQKQALINQGDRMFTGHPNPTIDAIDGVVHLIESLQDVAILTGRWKWTPESNTTPSPAVKPAGYRRVMGGEGW